MSIPTDGAAGHGGTSERVCFASWRDLLARTRDAEMTCDAAGEFTAAIRGGELGPVVLLWTSCPSVRVRRTERMIRRSDEEWYHLTVVTSGTARVRDGATGREEALAAGDLHLASSSHPYESWFLAPPGTGPGRPRVEGMGLDLPAALLPVPPHRLRSLFGRGLPGREGAALLLTQFLAGLHRQVDTLRPAEASRLGAAVVDLLAAVVARELDAEEVLEPEAGQRVLVERIRAYVRAHLHDPGLTPPAVAAAHHLSLSHLHSVFTRCSQGETVAAFIRRQRLRKACRELADPALQALPIQAVAARCGMPRPSDFARAFKAVYGLTPRDYRYLALASPGAG
ncbi:helix-turn-helix domain-containing protein [Kitasatospora setae]|uniref:Putative AraC family transcriptional regulator n=1 Tax=Kitasatospora setae (strain ATCC 33774 / DSM 43861 / JCM 3304 / KCC A-0304 / NBRC 14216 / KM-6054) TaxID=452652 RepID=E4N5W2_KITSK|nr:helix-turn-helix domain-containing protein [Kitasatospora sp. SID7827]BAJ26593.1 putative AraC family transcriptional regulator [Kitasatospora setae KM-6054]